MRLVLFDMDGTLTEPRQKINSKTVNALISLQNAGYEIGIVSGSDMGYIIEQCNLLFGINSFDYSKVHWLPCNGTKYYMYSENGTKKTIYENDMIEAIGKSTYRKLVSACIGIQNHIVESTDCPLTGLFYDYRGSMLNWCPIGRLASKEDREAWLKIDKDNNIRNAWISHLKIILNQYMINNLSIKLGGDTSFDIYPKGWDKTFCLRNFKDYHEIIFVGDRCEKLGNDYEIYENLKIKKNGYAYKTNSPDNTIAIMKKIIKEKQNER